MWRRRALAKFISVLLIPWEVGVQTPVSMPDREESVAREEQPCHEPIGRGPWAMRRAACGVPQVVTEPHGLGATNACNVGCQVVRLELWKFGCLTPWFKVPPEVRRAKHMSDRGSLKARPTLFNAPAIGGFGGSNVGVGTFWYAENAATTWCSPQQMT